MRYPPAGMSSTPVIRAMTLGQVHLSWKAVWRVLRRELPVTAGLELVLAYFPKGIRRDVLLAVGLRMEV